MKLALVLALVVSCTKIATPASNTVDGNVHDGGAIATIDGSTPTPDLCESEPDIQHAFDVWAAAQPTQTQLGSVTYHLDAIIEPTPSPAFAVTQHAITGGTAYDEDRFVIALDANGAELGRSAGRYIDRIAAGQFLLDRGYAHLSYVGSHDPLYYVALQLYASDRTGTELWQVATSAVAERSSVFRVGADHWLVLGLTHSSQDPGLTYFGADGTVSAPVVGDPRPCVVP